MKIVYKYLFILLGIISFFATCSKNKNSIPSLIETYSYNDKRPFGGYVAFHQLEQMFNDKSIINQKKSFNLTWDATSDTASIYVCITPALYLNEDEKKAMLGFVAAGNTLFIAANEIDENFLSTINCKVAHRANNYINNEDTFCNSSVILKDQLYTYFYKPFANYFIFKDKVFTKSLGFNENNKPNYILHYYGKGKIFLHCEVKTFSNYFLLKNENYKYFQTALSYTNNNPQHLYWDNYYRKITSNRNNNDESTNNFSSLSEIMKYPSLSLAFWVSISLMMIYIFVGIKRRQRVMEQIKPNENSTVAFAETIGKLYLQKKDNKNIAEKMVTFFNEYIRNKYYLNLNNINNDFYTSLAKKSGVEKNKVESLYRAIEHLNNINIIEDYQLLSLNEQMEQFYKTKLLKK